MQNWDSGTGTHATRTVGLGHVELGQFCDSFCMDCKCKDAKDCDVCVVFALDETHGDYLLVVYTLDGVRYGCRTCVDGSKVRRAWSVIRRKL